MSEFTNMGIIGEDEIVFNNKEGIHSGGFSVNSIMMKAGMSPIMTINNEQMGGAIDKVSDLFKNLVVPNWALSYPISKINGKQMDIEERKLEGYDDKDTVEDDLHDRLLDLVRQHNTDSKVHKKKITRKNRQNANKKRQTRRA